MKAKVSTLYDKGEFVGSFSGKTVVGELDLHENICSVCDEHTDDLLLQLNGVKFNMITKYNSITKTGMSISGIEQIGPVKYYQEWWVCVADRSEG